VDVVVDAVMARGEVCTVVAVVSVIGSVYVVVL